MLRTATLLLLLLPLLTISAAAEPLTSEVSGQLRGHLQEAVGPPVLRLSRAVPLVAEQLPDYYRDHGYRPVWLNDLGLTGPAHDFVEILRDSSSYGLCSDDFGLDLIEPLLTLEAESLRLGVLFDAHYLAILDLLLTDAYFRFAGELAGPGQSTKLVRGLDRERVRGDWRGLFAALSPDHPGYQRLLAQRRRLAELSVHGGWPMLPAGRLLRPGADDPRLPLLRQRLFIAGDLSDLTALEEAGYGPLTVAGVRHFQRRHGLDPDGVLGPETLAELNVPVEERISQIDLNLHRWRQLPHQLGERYIQVNVADFRLKVFEDDTPVLSMPVVVGTLYRQTPMFSARMSYIEFSPYWYVPETILREDKLPHIRRDPGWLARNHYEILGWLGDRQERLDPQQLDWSKISSSNFPGTLRMLPGPWNPLGRVKFIFPNRYAVYLHDTNQRNLFQHESRLFSSGCIRIARPLDLAQYLLENLQGWDCERIEDAMNAPEPLKVELPERLPVYLLYWTAWDDAEDGLEFRRDIYLRDLDQELARSSPPPAGADVAQLRANP